MSTPLPEGIGLNTIASPGIYWCYAKERQPLDPPIHMIQAIGPVPIQAWAVTDRKTGQTRIVRRALDVSPD